MLFGDAQPKNNCIVFGDDDLCQFDSAEMVACHFLSAYVLDLPHSAGLFVIIYSGNDLWQYAAAPRLSPQPNAGNGWGVCVSNKCTAKQRFGGLWRITGCKKYMPAIR